MIRVIIFVVLLFLIWVLFVSNFERQRKIIVASIAVVLCALAVWFDTYGEKPRTGVVSTAAIEVCGVTARHSYRTNYDVQLCLENSADVGDVKRIEFAVIAQRCSTPQACTVIEEAVRNMPINLPAQQTVTIEENLSFESVKADALNVSWTAEVRKVEATR